MARVATCVDASPPAEGADFSACTSVVWVEQPTLADYVPAWSPSEWGSVVLALVVTAACVWAARQLADVAG